jgi:hypothetical protein
MCGKKVTNYFNLKRTYVLMSFKGKGIDTLKIKIKMSFNILYNKSVA